MVFFLHSSHYPPPPYLAAPSSLLGPKRTLMTGGHLWGGTGHLCGASREPKMHRSRMCWVTKHGFGENKELSSIPYNFHGCWWTNTHCGTKCRKRDRGWNFANAKGARISYNLADWRSCDGLQFSRHCGKSPQEKSRSSQRPRNKLFVSTQTCQVGTLVQFALSSISCRLLSRS